MVWEEHGKTVLERLARDEPGKLATIAYGLLPRDLFVRVEDQRTPGNLDPDAYAALRSLLDVIEKCGAIGDPISARATNRLRDVLLSRGREQDQSAYQSVSARGSHLLTS